MAHQKNGFRLLPVAPETYAHLLPKGGEGVTIAEVQATDQLYDLVSRYVAQNGNKTSDHSHSWDISSHSATRSMPWGDDAEEDDNADWEESETKEKSRLGLGLGIHEVTFQGRPLRVVHQAIGKPVGSSCGVQVFTSLVLFAEGRNEQNLLTAFCDHVFEWDSVKDDDQYNIYMWKPDQWYWHKVATKRVRPVESVILPADIKTKVVKDLAGFNKRETARWYAHHGIPYKRCLLFHGPPGTGKSSFITALAGQLKRNVCFLQAAHPDITDDNLQACVQRAPSRSLIVMEDVDALFTRNRESMASNSPLTFSGLLNSLDGVCNPEGQVFILTTNHIERLDPALIRPGRVDLKVRFTTATKEQVEALFLHFYPCEADLAREFADVIASRAPEIISAFQAAEEKRKEEEAKAKTEEGKGEEEEKDASKSKPQEVKLLAPVEPDGGLGISMASLQQLFIVCRTSSAAEALTEARTFAF